MHVSNTLHYQTMGQQVICVLEFGPLVNKWYVYWNLDHGSTSDMCIGIWNWEMNRDQATCQPSSWFSTLFTFCPTDWIVVCAALGVRTMWGDVSVITAWQGTTPSHTVSSVVTVTTAEHRSRSVAPTLEPASVKYVTIKTILYVSCNYSSSV